MFYLSGASLPRLTWKKTLLNGCSVVVVSVRKINIGQGLVDVFSRLALSYLQCINIVGWVTDRASSLSTSVLKLPAKTLFWGSSPTAWLHVRVCVCQVMILNTNRCRTVPMLDSVNVPPDKSVGPSLLVPPSCISRLSSTAISNTLSVCTFFTLGTTRPAGVSIANPMLWAAYTNDTHTLPRPAGVSIANPMLWAAYTNDTHTLPRPAGVSIANPMLWAAYTNDTHTLIALFQSSTTFKLHNLTLHYFVANFPQIYRTEINTQ